MRNGFVFPLCVLGLYLLGQTTAPAYKQAIDPRAWSFPRDHGMHEGFRIEWWYFTGNLTDSTGRRFGYQLTFFRSQLSPEMPKRESPWATGELYFAHAAIADVPEKQFVYHDTLSRGRAGLASASDQTMDVMLKEWSAVMIGDASHLKASADDFAIDLECKNDAVVLQGEGGLSRKGPEVGQASYYYSMPRMATKGTLVVKGKQYAVSGLSWMDHEFSSNVLSPNQVGWDWISLQLADGRALMLYRLRNKDATDWRFGSLIAADGKATYLKPEQISMKGSEEVKAESGARYPQKWMVELAGCGAALEHFEVRALMSNCELRTEESTKVTYFEGPMEATGKGGEALGKGYLEMTGYAP